MRFKESVLVINLMFLAISQALPGPTYLLFSSYLLCYRVFGQPSTVPVRATEQAPQGLSLTCYSWSNLRRS